MFLSSGACKAPPKEPVDERDPEDLFANLVENADLICVPGWCPIVTPYFLPKLPDAFPVTSDAEIVRGLAVAETEDIVVKALLLPATPVPELDVIGLRWVDLLMHGSKRVSFSSKHYAGRGITGLTRSSFK
jgi:hypothetical protein